MLKQGALPHVSELPILDEDTDLDIGSEPLGDKLAAQRGTPGDGGLGFRELLARPEALSKRRRSTNVERDFDFTYRATPREVVRFRRMREAS